MKTLIVQEVLISLFLLCPMFFLFFPAILWLPFPLNQFIQLYCNYLSGMYASSTANNFNRFETISFISCLLHIPCVAHYQYRFDFAQTGLISAALLKGARAPFPNSCW